MRKLPLLSVLSLTLVGCASFEPDIVRRPLEVNQVLITVEPQVQFDSYWKGGDATWKDIDGLRHCTIRLKEYPFKLGHEADHCFRGKWHDDKPNSDDHG